VIAVDFARFLWLYSARCREWGWKRLFGFVRFALNRKSLIYCVDGAGRCLAVGIGRPISHGSQALDWHVRDDAGEVMWIDIAVARTGEALKTLWWSMRSHFPRQSVIGYERLKRNRKRYVFKDIGLMNRHMKV
jgi:hypothetical protein